MITMQEWMALVGYKITEGSTYRWSCYGPNAYALDSWNGVHGAGGHSLTILFSTKTQKVYEVSVCDFTNERAYRMILESKQAKHKDEAAMRNVSANEAWQRDDGSLVEYIDLDVNEDFLEKANAIITGEPYDTRVMISFDLDEELELYLYRQAHKADMTVNDFVIKILTDHVKERYPELV